MNIRDWFVTVNKPKTLSSQVRRLRSALNGVSEDLNQFQSIYSLHNNDIPLLSSDQNHLHSQLPLLQQPSDTYPLNHQHSLNPSHKPQQQPTLLMFDHYIIIKIRFTSSSSSKPDNLQQHRLEPKTKILISFKPLSKDTFSKPNQINQFSKFIQLDVRSNQDPQISALPQFNHFVSYQPFKKDTPSLPAQFAVGLLRSSQNTLQRTKQDINDQNCERIYKALVFSKDRPQVQDLKILQPRESYFMIKQSIPQNDKVDPKERPIQDMIKKIIDYEKRRQNLKKEMQKKQALKQKELKLPPMEQRCYVSYLDRFVRAKSLGKGKFSEVYLAQDKLTNQIVALKIIQKKTILKYKIQDLMIQEIKVMSYLDHPNIIKLWGVLEEEKQIILVLEVGGIDLQQKRKYLKESDFPQIIKDICLAVNYMHSEKIIHRDLKMENILMFENKPKIGDFGLVYRYRGRLLKDYCGTPGYMAPEVVQYKGYNSKCDVYSIGVIIHEMYFDQKPLVDDRNKQIIIKNKSGQLNDLLKSMLQYDQKQRLNLEQTLQLGYFQ